MSITWQWFVTLQIFHGNGNFFNVIMTGWLFDKYYWRFSSKLLGQQIDKSRDWLDQPSRWESSKSLYT